MIGLSFLNASDTFVDAKTGLMWQDDRAAKNTRRNWTEAQSYCSHLSLAGHSDWKLPSIQELQSIVDISRYDPAIKSGFKNVNPSDFYWSSSVYASNERAWVVHFKVGYTSYGNKSNEYYVRCVRGRQ